MRILKWPHKSLSRKTSKVTNIQEQVIPYIDNMKELVSDARVSSLAANQVGINRRFFILISENSTEPQVLINPELVDGFGETVTVETSPSIPSHEFYCPRAVWIKVKFQNLEGEIVEESFSSFESIAVQHQIDNLDGQTLADRSPVKKRSEIIESKY